MASITGLTLRQELINWGICKLLGTTTALSSAADRLRDATRLSSTANASGIHAGCWVRITSGTDRSFQAKVDYVDVDTGDLLFSPSASAAIAAGVTYEIWAEGVDPDDVDRSRDKALTKYCSQWALQPISEIPNGDFEDALGSANWVAQNSATIAAQTLSFPRKFARNTVLVTNDGAAVNGQMRSASLYYQPSQEVYLYAPVSVRSGTAEVIVRDITNGANVTLSGTATATGRGWTGIELTFTIPASCFEIQVWLRGQQATAIVEWGPVFFHGRGASEVGLPARIVSEQRAGPVYQLYNYAVVGSGTRFGEDRKEEVSGLDYDTIADSVTLRFNDSHLGDTPYLFSERIFYDALSTAYQTAANRTTGDDATTVCPLDYAVAGLVRALAELYLVRQREDITYWSVLHARAIQDLERFEREFGPKHRPRNERERSYAVHQLEV